MGDFGSLNIAYTGLNSHQKRISVIGENIANVDTPGYHRQRVELSPIDNLAIGLFSGTENVGGGVEVTDIARMRNDILSDHARNQSGIAASRAKNAASMTQLEQTIGGLDPGGLHDQMTSFFNSFDDLANAPEDPAIRSVVLQRAENVAKGFQRTVVGIGQLRDRTIGEAADSVRSINSLTEQIAVMDAAVTGALAVDSDPNALLDKRDALIAELSTVASVDVVDTEDGQVAISLDGYLLVSNGRSNTVEIEVTSDPGLAALDYSKVAVVNPSGRELMISGGTLGADLAALSQTIPDARRDIDATALDLATQVNAVHQAGAGLDASTGLDVFDIAANGKITVSADVAGQPDKLAAAGAGAGQLDNSNARTMAQLADSPTGPLTTFVQSVGSMAAKVASANGSADAARAASAQAESLALAEGGVSLDEELTDLITAQRAYEASARLMTAIDEMLQTLINRTGLVGR